MTTRAEILAEARSWLGTRWRHQGRTAQGIDCAGLVALVGGSLGLITHNPTDYPRRPDGSFLSHFQSCLEQRSVRLARPGDVLVFSDSGHACHCGIRGVKHGRPSVIHAHAQRRVVLEELLEPAASVLGPPIHCFAYPGVTDG